MVQAYLFALFTHFVSKLLADLQFSFFGPEAMVEIFEQKELKEKTENNIENGSDSKVEKVDEDVIEKSNHLENGNGDVDKKSKFSTKKRSKMLDRLRRKRRRPKGKNSPFENGRSHSESDGNTTYVT